MKHPIYEAPLPDATEGAGHLSHLWAEGSFLVGAVGGGGCAGENAVSLTAKRARVFEAFVGAVPVASRTATQKNENPGLSPGFPGLPRSRSHPSHSAFHPRPVGNMVAHPFNFVDGPLPKGSEQACERRSASGRT